MHKSGDKGTFYSGEKGTNKIGVDKEFIRIYYGIVLKHRQLKNI